MDHYTWEGRKVAILQPVYNAIEPCAHHTLFWAYAHYGPSKIALIPPVEHTCIWRARNILVDAWFRETDAEFAIMVDSDMAFPCGYASVLGRFGGAQLPPDLQNTNFIGQLMSHPTEAGIVGALYFGRNPSGKALCASAFESEGENRLIRTQLGSGLRQEKWVASGCMRIARWVVEKMKQEAPNLWPEIVPKNGGEYGLFNPMSALQGEDVAFGDRARQIGIQSYVDTSCVCLHKGSAYFGPHNTTEPIL